MAAIEEKAELQPYQQRVLEEQKDLDAKIEKLSQFLEKGPTHTIKSEELNRLRLQYQAMCLYSAILGQRIAAF